MMPRIPMRRLTAPLFLAALVGAFLAAQSADSAPTVSYSYDALGRLSVASYNNGTELITTTYVYDSAGNRSSYVTVQASVWNAFNWGGGIW
jgi:hypothetical protein